MREKGYVMKYTKVEEGEVAKVGDVGVKTKGGNAIYLFMQNYYIYTSLDTIKFGKYDIDRYFVQRCYGWEHFRKAKS